MAENRIELRAGALVYEVLVPAYLESQLRTRKGGEVELHVQHYLEGGPGSASMVPRLIGFMKMEDREFYNLLVKVPGLGSRSALKTMVAPPAEMARAIEQEDRMALGGLPGVGKRTADKIIATLKGKLTLFAAAAAAAPAPSWGDGEEEAVTVLLQLSYKRSEAEEMIMRAKKKNPGLDNAEDIIQAVFRETGGGAVR